MENIAIFKRFVRNVTVMLLFTGGMFALIKFSESVLGNSLYPVALLLVSVLCWLLWGMSRTQLESEAREKHNKKTFLTE